MSVFIFGTKSEDKVSASFDFSSGKTLQSGPGGRTALHIAVLQGDAIAVAELLRRGASIDATDDSGMRALHIAAAAAAAGEKVHICELLLEAGADIDCADNAGDTALHHAAGSGGVATVRFLLERGARVAVNGKGRTPRGVAEEKGWSGVAALFGEEEEGGWWERVVGSFGDGGCCEGRFGYGPCAAYEEGPGCVFCAEFYNACECGEEAEGKAGSVKRKWQI